MSLQKLANEMRKQGRKGDTELVHMTRSEVAGLSALAKRVTGKPLPKNPDTGLPEANILKSMLPTILGAAASFVGTPALGAAVGAAAGAAMNPEDRWGGAAMGALGGYGGGQLATGFMQAGANAGAQATAQGALQATTSTAPQQIAAMESMGLSAQEAAKTAAASQAAAQTAAQTAATTNAPLAADAAGRFSQAGQGFQSMGSMDGLDKFIGSAATKDTAATGMGGGYNTMMAAGKAAAPAMMAPASSGGGEEDMGELPRFRFDRKRGSGYAPGSGASSEQDWFDDSFTRMAAGGRVPPNQGLGRGTHSQGMSGMSQQAMEYLMGRGAAPRGPTPPANVGIPAAMPRREQDSPTVRGPIAQPGGGINWRNAMQHTVSMKSGGFVIPADVVAAAGAGSSNAGMEALAKKLGAKPIQGPGDGQSDSIPATIDGKHKARVARDEMLLTPEQVARVGGGDGSKGAKKLYAMMERIRKQATGSPKQMRPVKLDKALK